MGTSNVMVPAVNVQDMLPPDEVSARPAAIKQEACGNSPQSGEEPRSVLKRL